MPQVLDLKNKKPANSDKISGQINPEDHPVDTKLLIITGVVFALIGVGFLILQKSYVTATFFFLLVTVMFIMGFKKGLPYHWEVGTFGLTLDSFFYRYEDLKSFWIDYQPGHLKELSFQSHKWYHSYIKIPLHQENPLKIREFLLQFLPEERHEDTLVEIISRKFGI